MPALIDLLEDRYIFEGRYVADYAADVLEQIDPPEARIPLMKYRDWRAGAEDALQKYAALRG
jgi:hypothetical protein